jgi:hypothetical protein
MSKDRDKYCIKWIVNTNISFVKSPVNHINIAVFPSEVNKNLLEYSKLDLF